MRVNDSRSLDRHVESKHRRSPEHANIAPNNRAAFRQEDRDDDDSKGEVKDNNESSSSDSDGE